MRVVGGGGARYGGESGVWVSLFARWLHASFIPGKMLQFVFTCIAYAFPLPTKDFQSSNSLKGTNTSTLTLTWLPLQGKKRQWMGLGRLLLS